jgi:hypothetical protein
METAPLTSRLAAAVCGDRTALDSLGDTPPAGERDALLALLAVHDLHLAPIDRLAGAERYQHHPAVAALKWRLETDLLVWLGDADARAGWVLPTDAVAAMRTIGRAGAVPDVYRWVAEDASLDQLRQFLTLEGGPDGGFDDLVAACQIGLDGEPKLELARNYWDEMGNGSLDRVHTELHRKLARALRLEEVDRAAQPVEALRRSALGSLLATNRHLQPEMVGALGLLELQAGPRCRAVVEGLRRLGASDDALDFYVEHAETDPRHGKDWLDNVVAPLGRDRRWAGGITRGARWRSLVNTAFFDAMGARLLGAPRRRQASLAS